MAESKFPTDLHDKNGEALHEDDVIYDGKNYYRIYWNELFPQVEAIGAPGYIHDITQKDLLRFERIGPFVENEELMYVD